MGREARWGFDHEKNHFFCVFPYMYIFVEEKGRFFDKSLLAQLFCCLRKGGGGYPAKPSLEQSFFSWLGLHTNISLLTHPFF